MRYKFFKLFRSNDRNYTVIIIFVTQYALFLKAINQCHIKQGRQCFGGFSGNGISIGIQHASFTVMGQWSHNRHNALTDQCRQKTGIYFLHITNKAIVHIFYRTLYRTDHIHIGSGQSNGIHTFCLKTGYNILVHQSAIYHGYHFQRFCIRNAAAIHHLAFNP